MLSPRFRSFLIGDAYQSCALADLATNEAGRKQRAASSQDKFLQNLRASICSKAAAQPCWSIHLGLQTISRQREECMLPVLNMGMEPSMKRKEQERSHGESLIMTAEAE